MKPRRLAVVAVATAAVLSLASCTESETLVDPDSPVASYSWSRSDGGMDALVSGYLLLLDGCLVISSTEDAVDAGSIVVPVFSRSYGSWDVETQRLTYDPITYDLGAYVEFGGGFVDYDTLSNLDLPDACARFADGDGIFLVQE